MSKVLTRREFLATATTGAVGLAVHAAELTSWDPTFQQRGYYLLPNRTPTLGERACLDLMDCIAEDGGNTVILWMAGGFRSRKFPITWAYNAEHQNVRRDFGGALIRHAQKRGIQVLLGFTPFGYDGVNQYPLEHPELKAIGPDGNPVEPFGIHCWGWNLCPAKADSQRFMLEYTRELAFEFYPEADGLFIESSDYAICHCPDCGPRHFEHEFAFVKQISDEMWARKPNATVVVYPHYFSGAKLRFTFSEAAAIQQKFDSRWTLFFTPHSAAIDPGLIAKARGSWWWNEAPSRFNLSGIRSGAQKARSARCTGFIPSLECYSYVQTHEEFGETWLKGRRQTPFGFGWLAEGESPYRQLPARAARLAYRAFTSNPDLTDQALRDQLDRELFNAEGRSSNVEDLMELCRVFGTDRDWSVPAPLTTPGLVESRRQAGRLSPEKRAFLRDQLSRVQSIAERNRKAGTDGGRELARIAQWIAGQWKSPNSAILEG